MADHRLVPSADSIDQWRANGPDVQGPSQCTTCNRNVREAAKCPRRKDRESHGPNT
ncbi:hypothetical protein K0M31_007989 [Melipona bicolor]|uniref:Uncharacterized protein n=1 Tax=Melipona bicolor TaxID=60889 RepID=A0AA40GCG2_9HYME|nr:hypothetical protein K0M31_007989 [Melipona bicolor]